MADEHESVPLNKLIPYYEIGMPYHGLAVDGTLTTSDGDKTIHAPSASGICQVVRHPLAPGVNRNTNQLARDTAKGYEWRDYALLTGLNRGVNGSQGVIGADKWLYCDAGGNTWIVGLTDYDTGVQPPPVTHEGVTVSHIGTTVTHTGTLQNSQMEFYLWLEGTFGRYGKPYPFERRFLKSLVWSPTIPSWYSGIYSAADIVPYVYLRPESIVFEADGSAAYVNLYMDTSSGTALTIARDVYYETMPYHNDQDFSVVTGDPMIGVLRVDLTGIGDLNSNGTGIEATITKDMDFETDMVLYRDKWANDSSGVATEDIILNNPLDCPVTSNEQTTYIPSYTLQTGDPSGYRQRSGYNFKSVMYKSFDGLITQAYEGYNSIDWTVQYSGGQNDSYQLDSSAVTNPIHQPPFCGGSNPNWYCVGCSLSGYFYSETVEDIIFKLSIEYDVYGQIEKNDYQEIDRQTRVEAITEQSQPPTGGCSGLCNRPPPNESSVDESFITINGQPLNSASRIFFEIRPNSPNCIYTAVDIPQNPDPSTRDLLEDYVGVTDLSVVKRLLEKVTPHAPITVGNPIPDTRELLWSYQPVTDEFISDQTTLDQPIATSYQYV